MNRIEYIKEYINLSIDKILERPVANGNSVMNRSIHKYVRGTIISNFGMTMM